MEVMEGGLSPRPEIVEEEERGEDQRADAAAEAAAVREMQQSDGRKRSALERSPARGAAAVKIQRAEVYSMEVEQEKEGRGAAAAGEEVMEEQQLFVEDRVGDRLGAGGNRTEPPGGALEADKQSAAAGGAGADARPQAVESPGPDPSGQRDWVETIGKDWEERKMVLKKAQVAERVKPGGKGGELWRRLQRDSEGWASEEEDAALLLGIRRM